ncbi:MAG: phosphotransferase family protein [Pseudomonadota bacterium]
MRMTQEIESRLNHLVKKLQGSSAYIGGLERLSGGASQESWRFDVHTEDDAIRSLVLRRAPEGDASEGSDQAIALNIEAGLIKTAGENGVPVPDITHICTPADGLGEAYIMAFINGETIGRKILRDAAYALARKSLPTDCGRALAVIHETKPPANVSIAVSNGPQQVEAYEETYRSLKIDRPVFELALQKLKRSAPPPVGPVLVHGDFRLGNLMVDPNGLVAVLDWELAHLGDPREDLGWLCVNSWRFGETQQRAGGFGQLEDVLSAYASAGGAVFTPDEVDWWELLGSLKWGIMCMMMYDSYRSGAVPTVERAAIGRRVSETEIDILNLIEKMASHV